MKTFLLCLTTAVFLISCSSDPDFETAADFTADKTVQASYPANSANPFDKKGKKIYDVISEYRQTNHSFNSVSELTGQIRFISEKIDGRKNTTSRLIPFNDEMVEAIMADPQNSMITIVQNSSLQPYVKSNLTAFLQELILKRQEEFSVSYHYITAYESDVLTNTVFSSEETETILTVSSIARYSLYSEQERKDRDWDIIVNGRPARPFFEVNEVPIITVIAILEMLLH